MPIVSLLAPVLFLAHVASPSNEPVQSQPLIEIRPGGDPSTSRWWRDWERDRWDSQVSSRRGFIERPGRMPFCDSSEPLDVRGSSEARRLLRAAWQEHPDLATAGLFAGLMETGALTPVEYRELLRNGPEHARVEILRRLRLAKEPSAPPLLIRTFNRSERDPIRIACLQGLESLQAESSAPWTLKENERYFVTPWLLRVLENDSLSAAVHLACLRTLRVAAPEDDPDGESGSSELKCAEERSQTLRRLLAYRLSGPAELRHKVDDVILAILYHHRRWARSAPAADEVKAAFEDQLRKSQDLEGHGTALIQLARLHGTLTSENNEHLSFAQCLQQHLAEAVPGEGDWVAVAAFALEDTMRSIGAVTESNFPLLIELMGYLKRCSKAGTISPALATTFEYGGHQRDLLPDWVSSSLDPETLGARLRVAVRISPLPSKDSWISVIKDGAASPSFWQWGASAAALLDERGEKDHILVRALQRGQGLSWSTEELLPIVDALGMCATDPAAACLMDVVRRETPGSQLHEHAAWALGRIFEYDRHDHSLGRGQRPAALYPQGSF